MVTNKQSWIYHWLRVGKRVRGLELWAWRHAQAETSGKAQKKAAQRALVVTDLSCEGACRALCSPIALPALFLCCLGSWRGSHKKWNSSPQLSGIKSNCLRETITKAHILDQLSGGSPGVAVGVYSRPPLLQHRKISFQGQEPDTLHQRPSWSSLLCPLLAPTVPSSGGITPILWHF